MFIKMLCKFASILTPFECLDSEERQRLLTGLQLLKMHPSECTCDECLLIDATIQ
ncbi:hypothetical protein HRbin17_01246 [bacterium HR17]|jgi:hypothetical protein|uniref:Uncharacterized protein n=1 Tax=Candidatus Fervidibacter japonicus TaxID=2035412 RepID=A0A2H5XC22_9BACT|nr:hypothetical protein HRbin17_01246 [bacterium HR17]